MVVVVIIPHIRVRTPGEHEFWCPFFCKHLMTFPTENFTLSYCIVLFRLTISYSRLAFFFAVLFFFFDILIYPSLKPFCFVFFVVGPYRLFCCFVGFAILLPWFCFFTLTFCTLLPLAKGRTNLELREQFILPEGASQGMTPFKTRASPNSSVSSQPGTGQMVVSPLHARSPSLPTAGPITKVRLLPIATNLIVLLAFTTSARMLGGRKFEWC